MTLAGDCTRLIKHPGDRCRALAEDLGRAGLTWRCGSQRWTWRARLRFKSQDSEGPLARSSRT